LITNNWAKNKVFFCGVWLLRFRILYFIRQRFRVGWGASWYKIFSPDVFRKGETLSKAYLSYRAGRSRPFCFFYALSQPVVVIKIGSGFVFYLYRQLKL